MDEEKGIQEGTFSNVSPLAKFSAGGVNFEMKPLNLKRLRILKGVFTKAIDDLQKMEKENAIDAISDIFFKNYEEILKILIPEQFMTNEFIDENIDLPLARSIAEKAIEINRLADLYPFLKSMIQKGKQS